jgi:hypothetical protein
MEGRDTSAGWLSYRLQDWNSITNSSGDFHFAFLLTKSQVLQQDKHASKCKRKDKGLPVACHEGIEGKSRGVALIFL